MVGDRWYQIRWSGERTDNISAPNLEAAYAYAWHVMDEAGEDDMIKDCMDLWTEDMATGYVYAVPG